ncbi:hypothetical protein [Streptomyces erythrochromogenes]|uniref:hypothetical protein n=1 Tax=Streptomyces erythrochromogenes TaxID=285574 RepID=UPI00386D973A|nr:hypothetical protein OG489_00255 [Streptomyces erythrochromogenes]WSR88317.1 hypothetical protein OG489_39705 [Streptomyces erythrochromogenes]
MSTATIPSRANLLREASLTICGRREGKTKACNSCLRKADAVVRLARAGEQNRDLVPRLADIVCGSASQPCRACWYKTTTLLLELRG